MAARPSSGNVSRRGTDQNYQEVMIGPFRRLESVGQGSFASVYRGVHDKKGLVVAIKSVDQRKLNKKLKENLWSEIRILESLHHPHIVQLINTVEMPTQIHLVMEFCKLGDLSMFIKKRATLGDHPATAEMARKYPSRSAYGLNEVLTRHFVKQIASALEFMRKKGYAHRDIKPQNLLLNPSPQWFRKHAKHEQMPLTASENSLVPVTGVDSLPMLKIADFGFARSMPQTSLAETLCGSPLYMAPEILRYEKYDARTDLWSVGAVTYEMIVGKTPFRAANHVDLLRRIENAKNKIDFPEGIPLGADLEDMVRRLLMKEPHNRISFDDFFAHEVLTGEIPGLVSEDKPTQPSLLAQAIHRPATSRQVSRTQDDNPPVQSAEKAERSGSGQHSQSPRETGMIGTPPRESRPIPTSRRTEQFPNLHRRSIGSSTAPDSPALEPRQASLPERRPAMASRATAPAQQELRGEPAPITSPALVQHRSSRATPSPSASMLREQLDRERNVHPQKKEDRAAREARERAAQDVAFERDYVLVEKRAVEVNAFADELAASPQVQRGQRENTQNAMIRRATTQGQPTSVAGVQASPTARAMQTATGKARPNTIHQRNSSYERRYGPSPSSATSAISRALNMANFRLFGMGISPPLGIAKGPSPPQGYTAFPAYPATQANLVLLSDAANSSPNMDEDAKILATVEEAATRSDVVYGFAEVKYKQLVPSAPTNDNLSGARRTIELDVLDDDGLTVDVIVEIAEEALVLYVKTLAVLHRTFGLAAAWWAHRSRAEMIPENASPRTQGFDKGNATAVMPRMNSVVQWARDRFNDCLGKSEYVIRKLSAAQRRLPTDHPGHPSNWADNLDPGTMAGLVSSAEKIYMSTGVTAEKLMYERAVEMSRSAAVDELVNEDLPGCEISYITAVRMLEAVLESDDDTTSGVGRRNSGKDKKGEAEAINGMESEDRKTVEKVLQNVRQRLAALMKKMAMQRQQANRASTTPTPRVAADSTCTSSETQTKISNEATRTDISR